MKNRLPKLPEIASTIRQDVVEMLAKAGSGHSAGSLGMADVFTALYFGLLRHNPHKPWWQERDRLILSCGHICPVLYATLARSGYFPVKELDTLRQIGSRLEGHPYIKSLPGIEVSSGPLGQGVSVAVGLALAGKRDLKTWRVVCITSDGEQQEGQVWEAYLAAAKYKLDNLVFILDRNNIQIDGYVSQVMPLEPLVAKYRAFGLMVFEVDGHRFDEITEIYLKAKTVRGQPTMIIAHTIPGKDVEFMENLPVWHGKPPSPDEAVEALKQLRHLGGKVSYE